MNRATQRVSRLAPTIFTEFPLLAQKAGSVSPGQGFPDFDGPEEVKEAAIEATGARAPARARRASFC